ncbi:hypothetical protein LINPERPRIM_LOCUS39698 [Linum perenne]
MATVITIIITTGTSFRS